MAVSADYVRIAVSQVASNAGDDSHWQATINEDRSLLDMEFEEAGDARGIELPLAGANAFGREAQLPHVLGQRAAGVGTLAGIERLRLQQAEGRAAADIGCGKP